MVIVQDLLVSDDILHSHFICDLNRCKGACCVEGDFGAPLEDAELATLDEIMPKVFPYLPQKSVEALMANGAYYYVKENKEYCTTLVDDGPCAFMTMTENGISACGIEMAWKDGKIDWQKPISCHLYPVRTVKNSNGEDYALNYDRWDICRNACNAKLQVPLFRFVKDALVRKYGSEFYDQLEAYKLELDAESNS